MSHQRQLKPDGGRRIRIYFDGHQHTPEDEAVRTFSGESIGRREGNARA